MNAFPHLKTGAVAQYPAKRNVNFGTQIVSFVDGTEQRFAGYGSRLHSWIVELDKLDEQEITALSQFFKDNAGSSGVFSFVDPWDGTVYPSCSFANDSMDIDLLDVSRGRTRLTIIENRD